MRPRKFVHAGAWVALLVVLTGCLERNEHLTIRPDGSVFMELNYKSDALSDLYNGDAVPAPGSGWVVEERTKTGDDGKNEYTLHAVRVVDATSALPSSYATPGAEEVTQALRFPTHVTIEARDGGMYYHFHRVYEPRRWAYVQLKRAELIDKPLEGLAGKDESELTASEKLAVLRGFANFEIEKALIFAREAHREVAPELPQDWWLDFAAAIRSIPDEIDFASFIELLSDADDEEKSKQFEAEVARWQAVLHERIEKGARDLMHYTPSQVNRFQAAIAQREAEYAVSEDLGDDVFRITVDMPGAIVASNAKSANGGTARWEFSGQQLRDNTIELMVTSVAR